MTLNFRFMLHPTQWALVLCCLWHSAFANSCSEVNSPKALQLEVRSINIAALELSPRAQCLAAQNLMRLHDGPYTGGWRIFHDTQSCIAQASCQQLPQFEQPQWLGKVLYGFIRRYTQRLNNWPRLMRQCALVGDVLCLDSFVNEHINTDLASTLEVEGCGSNADWTRVEHIITSCVQQQPQWWVQEFGAMATIIYRNNVRSRCLQNIDR